MPTMPISGNDLARFSGPQTFMRLPQVDGAKGLNVGFIGVPMDIGTSWRSGTRMGPKQIREQSAMIRPYNIQTGAAPFDALECGDLGDVAINTFSLSDTIRLITEVYDAHLKHDFTPMSLGGDHSMTLPILRSIAKKHGPVALVHVDANGVVLQPGDNVVLIKDLKVKGSSMVAKQGTAVRRIALDPENATYIEGKVDGQQIVILTQYVKKTT